MTVVVEHKRLFLAAGGTINKIGFRFVAPIPCCIRHINLSLLVKEASIGQAGRVVVSTGLGRSLFPARFPVLYKDRVERNAHSSANCSRSAISFQARRSCRRYGARGGFSRVSMSVCRVVV